VEHRWRLLHQPVLILALQGTVLQAECMARLVDAQGALLPASNFIPMASRHRLIPEVDRVMVTLTLAYLKQNTKACALVAINLSHQSMVAIDLMDWFVARLDALDGSALRLAIEMSEFAALRHKEAAMRVQGLVRARGGKFGIDHFGLDPKALKLLRDMLPDYVKLNGALVDEVEAVESVSDMLHVFCEAGAFAGCVSDCPEGGACCAGGGAGVSPCGCSARPLLWSAAIRNARGESFGARLYQGCPLRTKKLLSCRFFKSIGLPGGDRTPDPQLRRLLLYPTELRAEIERNLNDGRGERIRTFDPLVPNQMRYQAALRPDWYVL
jgi:EAL domain-containing protein (putative c-di-GMP-specific phosphodiesterase class I)